VVTLTKKKGEEEKNLEITKNKNKKDSSGNKFGVCFSISCPFVLAVVRKFLLLLLFFFLSFFHIPFFLSVCLFVFFSKFFILLLGGRSRLWDAASALDQGELNVARAAHVRASATVRAVCTTAHARGLVDLHVGDDELGRVEALGERVGLSVLEQAHHRDDALAWPAALGHAPLLTLAGAADLAVVAAERDAAGLAEHLAVVLLGLAQRHVLNHVGGLERVLEVARQVGNLRERGFRRDTRLAGVVHLVL